MIQWITTSTERDLGSKRACHPQRQPPCIYAAFKEHKATARVVEVITLRKAVATCEIDRWRRDHRDPTWDRL